MSFSTVTRVHLKHLPIDKQHSFTNILLIDNQVKDFKTIVDSLNTNTFPIIYSTLSSKADLLALLKANFTVINRIGLVFTSNSNSNSIANYSKMFLDEKSFFENENTNLIINLIKEFKVKNIDYLACNTLNYLNWTNYYNKLHLETGVTVGASKDKTGNIKYGGDWIMESTSQDIELVYFTKSIEYYTFLLDNPTWSSGYGGGLGQMVFDGNYMYFPNFDTNTIIQTDLNGNIINDSWATSTQGLYQPQCCIVFGDYLYVSNYGGYNGTPYSTNASISKISLTSPDTVYTANWATSVTQGLWLPTGMTIYDSYLYVCNAYSNTIINISLSNPNAYTVWVTYNPDLNGPVGLANDGSYLYVCNGNPDINTIIKFDLGNANNYTSWATSAQGLNNPSGITINGNYLYVCNSGNNTISKISLASPDTYWATSTQGLNTPSGMTVNGNYLYVSNRGNGTISQISLSSLPCFKADSMILTDKGYKPIQELRKGDLVKTLLHGFKPIDLIGKSEMYHSANFEDRIEAQLYTCSQSEYPEVFKDLVITGRHSILVDDFINEEQKQKTIKVNGKIYVTDRKYRLPVCVDLRASVFRDQGTYTIYHLALENENYYTNYGVYANGLLVETCSQMFLKELSNMTLIE